MHVITCACTIKQHKRLYVSGIHHVFLCICLMAVLFEYDVKLQYTENRLFSDVRNILYICIFRDSRFYNEV